MKKLTGVLMLGVLYVVQAAGLHGEHVFLPGAVQAGRLHYGAGTAAADEKK
jgi:hypothetical protein